MELVTAGESHGGFISGVVTGFPAGVRISSERLNGELSRRRVGAGRSERQGFEKDSWFIDSGVIDEVTTGAPIAFRIVNSKGSPFFERRIDSRGFPRPGHVDFAAAEKFGYSNPSVGAERSSARETVARVFAGGLARCFLEHFRITISSEVVEIGGIAKNDIDLEGVKTDSAEKGTFGGVFRVVLHGSVPGVGSNSQWMDRLDSALCGSFASIPSCKGVYIGSTEQHRLQGMNAVDRFSEGFERVTNRAGGIEGGISNGEKIEVTAFCKPIPTQPFPVESRNYITGEAGLCDPVRSDLWAVESAACVGEAVMAFTYMNYFMKKFGEDRLGDIDCSFRSYLGRIRWKKGEKSG